MVRVRYAPSPTGSPHVGNIRTALFNYLMARRHGGAFLVRIEDTDKAREVPGAVEEILESLRWLGLQWNEGPDVGGDFGPYFQSERLTLYHSIAEKLLDSGAAYRCYCTPQELREMREFQRINNMPTGYDRRCRFRKAEELEALAAEGRPFVVRLAMPLEGEIRFEDAVRGVVSVEAKLVDDQVLLKTDGFPTYHLANVVDDHEQGITHVIRGDEWISSTPKHVVLYRSLGWEMPVFAHAPIIKGPDGAKLSKRHGDTRCLDYRDKGYLAAAVANFIALIGWSPGDEREKMSLNEMAEAFSIDRIQPNPGVFDIAKLQWMNGLYIRDLSPDALYETVKQFHFTTQDEEYRTSPSARTLGGAFENESREYVTAALALEQERVRLLSEFASATEFLFLTEPPMDDDGFNKWLTRDYVPALLDAVLARVEDKRTIDQMEQVVNESTESVGLQKRADAIHPLRVALTGRTKGPGLFELMAVLGPSRIVARLKSVKEQLASRTK
ncbi:MAG: glutamate--tRNA ligase [Armatimonadota bacterium]